MYLVLDMAVQHFLHSISFSITRTQSTAQLQGQGLVRKVFFTVLGRWGEGCTSPRSPADGGSWGAGQGCQDLVEEQIKQAGRDCRRCPSSAGAGPRNAMVSDTSL